MITKYIELDQSIKKMPAQQIRQKLGGVSKAVLMRSIILNERDFLTVDYDRALRGFWYTSVKPCLEKLGLLTESDQEEEKLTAWDAELSRYMAGLVREGEMTYKDLRIRDTSRQRENPSATYLVVDQETYGYKVTIAPYSNIIFCTEKDTVYSIIKDMASFFGCCCISGKGQNSLGAMEDLMRGLRRESDIYIFTITDYDPAGYYIAETFKKQAEDLSRVLNFKGNVYIKRIGITPDQLTPEEVEQNKYTPKPANLEKWLKATGGINGEGKGLELDALTPDRIRELFVTTIKTYVNPELYMQFIKTSYLRMLVLDALKLKIDEIIEDITNDEIDNVEMEDFDLFQLAAMGHDQMPISDLCFITDDAQIEERVLRYFK